MAAAPPLPRHYGHCGSFRLGAESGRIAGGGGRPHAGTETRRGGTPREQQRRQAAAKAAAHAKRLDDLAAEGEAPWKRVDEMIAAKKTSEYDLAVSLLRDLREVAERQDEAEQFSKRVLG